MPETSPHKVLRYHCTALSNFALGYDRYEGVYSKREIKESRFPTRFYLLEQANLHEGVQRAQKLVSKLGIPHDDVIALETNIAVRALQENTATGIGQFIEADNIDLSAVYAVNQTGSLSPMSIEDAYASSMKATRQSLPRWEELTPRTISILPVAHGCQAACSFCFSEASISRQQAPDSLSDERVSTVLRAAKMRGAQRAVITGGGEPGLLSIDRLCALTAMAASIFAKVVLITNGFFLSKMSEHDRRDALRNLAAAGLTTLAVSRHHHNPIRNEMIMRLPIEGEAIADAWQAVRSMTPQLRLRWICVLQKGFIDSEDEVNAYLEWSAATGVDQICFKQLYVASGLESVFFDQSSNLYSAEHQVSLRVVLDSARKQSWQRTSRLPWGAPIFQHHNLSIAAYTEPNVTWELRNKMCRSWNLLADGKCYASLEDGQSLLEIL